MSGSILLRHLAKIDNVPQDLKHFILSQYHYTTKDGAEAVNYIYDSKANTIYLPPNPEKLEYIAALLDREIIDERSKGLPLDKPFELNPEFTLRESQVEPVEQFIKHLKEKQYGTLIAPCGSGKSVMLSRAVPELGCKTLVVCDQDLSAEWAFPLRLIWGRELQVLKNSTTKFADFSFSTLQLLYQNPELLSRVQEVYGALIVDECQLLSNAARTYQHVIFRLNNYYRAACTATFYSKNYPIEIIADTVAKPSVIVTDAESLTADIVFVRTGVKYCTNDPQDISRIISGLAKEESRNNLIVDLVRRAVAAGRKTIIINTSQEQIDQMYPVLKTFCSPAVYTSKTGKKDVDTIPARFEANEFNVLMTIKKIRKGKSLPSADCLIFSYPSNDEAMVTQIRGRVERYVDGKNQPVVVALVDTEDELENIWNKPYNQKTLAEVFAWKHRRWYQKGGCRILDEVPF